MNQLLLIGFLVLLLNSCQNQTITTNSMETENVILVKQNTVVTLEGARIGNGNYFTRNYELPDGTTKNGLSAKLWFPDETKKIVGLGSVFSVKDKRYEVIEIDKKYKDRDFGFMKIKEIK